MREIKFRAKSPYDKVWIYGDLIQYANGECAIFGERLSAYGYEATEIIKRYKVDKDTIGQFTGLYDKNGNEIYEGDIVKRENRPIGYILFLPQESGFVVVTKNTDERFGHRYGDGGYKMLNFEIIGNIYDNKELLNKEI